MRPGSPARSAGWSFGAGSIAESDDNAGDTESRLSGSLVRKAAIRDVAIHDSYAPVVVYGFRRISQKPTVVHVGCMDYVEKDFDLMRSTSGSVIVRLSVHPSRFSPVPGQYAVAISGKTIPPDSSGTKTPPCAYSSMISVVILAQMSSCQHADIEGAV
ncbi:hypothetical protein JUN65_05805 [Gluconacetobacter azotocaptans]|uniref:hypothetical protein n=1 Tax=Gluconacetobacter azotocaptans TaxID=142834 RepID=UPI0019590B59|nr:hypothetical protein [Gluconacetobacter azotocaptans]MBM9401095.1 hypothetical protein [Gluconacetobacter azotocaptans]